jgi:hypothetical protein
MLSDSRKKTGGRREMAAWLVSYGLAALSITNPNMQVVALYPIRFYLATGFREA